MPIPENPQSRSEQYLNAIATGDNSGLPEFPQSRMEQYLEVIAQNGGGGGGGGVLVVHPDENGVLDKTWQEIYDAGFSVLELSFGGRSYGILAQIAESGGDYAVIFATLGQSMSPRIYVANSANGYPVYTAT